MNSAVAPQPDLEMEVRGGGVAGQTDLADLVAFVDPVADLHIDNIQVGIDAVRRQIVRPRCHV